VTNLCSSSRRSGWLTLLAATGAVLGVAYAVHRHRQRRGDQYPEATRRSRPQPATEPVAVTPPDDPAVPRPRFRPAFVLALLLVLAVAAVTAIHLSGTDSTALPNRRLRTESPATHPGDVVLPLHLETASRTEWPVPTEAPRPSPAVVPDSFRADGRTCGSGEARPVLDTMHPVLAVRLTTPAPDRLQLFKKSGDFFEYVYVNSSDLTTNEHGDVTLYPRLGLERGELYRWELYTTTSEQSPWCEFRIAALAPASPGLQSSFRTARLSPSKWRRIRAVLDNPSAYRPIYEASRRVSKSDVAAKMQTQKWETVIELMAERASATDDLKLWRLVDTLSVKLGGPPYPTMGFTRA
jgi:hypothetical protein